MFSLGNQSTVNGPKADVAVFGGMLWQKSTHDGPVLLNPAFQGRHSVPCRVVSSYDSVRGGMCADTDPKAPRKLSSAHVHGGAGLAIVRACARTHALTCADTRDGVAHVV